MPVWEGGLACNPWAATSAPANLDDILPAMLLEPRNHACLAAGDASPARPVCRELWLVCSHAQLAAGTTQQNKARHTQEEALR